MNEYKNEKKNELEKIILRVWNRDLYQHEEIIKKESDVDVMSLKKIQKTMQKENAFNEEEINKRMQIECN